MNLDVTKQSSRTGDGREKLRLFDDVASKDVNVETRRVARSRRRRINRQRIRKSDYRPPDRHYYQQSVKGGSPN